MTNYLTLTNKATNILKITIFHGTFFVSWNKYIKFVSGSDWLNLKGFKSVIIPFSEAKWYIGSYILLYLLLPYYDI